MKTRQEIYEELYNQGLSREEIAKQMGITMSEMETWHYVNMTIKNAVGEDMMWTVFQRPPSRI